jgi:hypothetical protein
MKPMGRVLAVLALCTVALSRNLFAVSPVAEFEARYAQTQWNIQVVEGILRSVEFGSDSQSTPEALAAHLALLSENVSALTSLALSNLTSEQKRFVALSLKMIAGRLKDQALLSGGRGLLGAASSFNQLETSCLVAIRLL